MQLDLSLPDLPIRDCDDERYHDVLCLEVEVQRLEALSSFTGGKGEDEVVEDGLGAGGGGEWKRDGGKFISNVAIAGATRTIKVGLFVPPASAPTNLKTVNSPLMMAQRWWVCGPTTKSNTSKGSIVDRSMRPSSSAASLLTRNTSSVPPPASPRGSISQALLIWAGGANIVDSFLLCSMFLWCGCKAKKKFVDLLESCRYLELFGKLVVLFLPIFSFLLALLAPNLVRNSCSSFCCPSSSSSNLRLLVQLLFFCRQHVKIKP